MRRRQSEFLKNCHYLAFKNWKYAHFMGWLLTKCLQVTCKMPQMHNTSFARKLASSFSLLGCEMSYSQLTRENASEGIFQQNRFGSSEKLLKHKWYTKSLSKKEIKYSKIFLGLIIKQLSIHKSHLNTYNHTNEIDIHWTLVLCVNQVCTSP